jgi:hypothetical protein
MARFAQIGIALGTLGTVLMLMALYPGMTGLDPTPGIGVVQVFIMLLGFSLLILGALLYAKLAFYTGIASNLAQQIGTRLALTGIMFAAMAGLADLLGFGSHGVAIESENFLGKLQAVGILGSYTISCLGVLIYAVAGRNTINDAASQNNQTNQSDNQTGTDSPQ